MFSSGVTVMELAVVVWVWTPTLCLGLFHRRFMQWHTIIFAWERWGNPCGLDQAEKGSGKKTVMVLTIPLMLAYLPQYIHLWPLSFRSTTNVWWQFLPSSWPYSYIVGGPIPLSSSMMGLSCFICCVCFADMNGVCDSTFWLIWPNSRCWGMSVCWYEYHSDSMSELKVVNCVSYSSRKKACAAFLNRGFLNSCVRTRSCYTD